MKKITLLILLLFISLQIHSQVLLTQNFNTTLGWTSSTVTSDTGTTISAWTRKTTGVAPTCAPFFGAGMVRFNSYNIPLNGTGRLTSPAIAFMGADYRIRFQMYRDSGYDTDADNVKVYVNSTNTLAGATLLGTINRSTSLAPTESADGWYQYIFNFPAGTTGSNYVILSGTSAYGNNIYMDEINIEQIPTNDVQMKSLDLGSLFVAGSVPINGVLKNIGATTINSLDLNWQANSGVVYTQSLTGLNIANNQTYPFTHADVWNATPGQYAMNVWITNINGGVTESDVTNNQITRNVYVVNEIFPKTAVYEEGTGTWCQWCPRGHVGLKDMIHNHDDGTFIGIAVHNNDPMTLAAYNTGLGGYISGYPSGVMNRAHAEVDAGITVLEPAYQSEIAKLPIAKVTISNQVWDANTRQITFDAQSVFALDITNANYNLAAVIVENQVTGTASSYNQVNAYSGYADLIDWEGNNWNLYANPVPAASMVYNHVGRALLGGFTGYSGSVPNVVTYNVPNNYSFSYTLPTTQNENNTELVVLLLDNATGQIVNAKQVPMQIPLAINTFANNKFVIYPNPSTGIYNVIAQKPIQVHVTDALGKVVFSNDNQTTQSQINLTGMQSGIYFAKINDSDSSDVIKLILK